MNYGHDLIRLALGHPVLIEDAQAVLGEANEIFLGKLHEYTDEQCSDSFTVTEIDDLCFNFGRPEWGQTPKGEPTAAFYLECEGEDTEDRSWLSVLTGQTLATSGFFFWVNYKDFGIKTKAWKKYLCEQFAATPAFRDAGFALNADGDAIIKPFTLDAACLAENYPNLDECFDSVGAALDAIEKLLPEFEKIIQKAKHWA